MRGLSIFTQFIFTKFIIAAGPRGTTVWFWELHFHFIIKDRGGAARNHTVVLGFLFHVRVRLGLVLCRAWQVGLFRPDPWRV